jgi:leader peptidase (prepilin peptidase) / N-methyltransferase
MQNLLFVLIAIPLGMIAGAVVNWLADDLPERYRPRPPHYPDGTPRPFFSLIGFARGRRTSAGGARLGLRYPLVEIGMMLLYAYVALAFPVSLRSVFWFGAILSLMLITVIDLEHRLILYIVIVPSCVYALLGALLINERPFIDHVIGGLVGFGIFFIFYFGGILFIVVMSNARGEDVDEVAFGFGDVMLATFSGLLLGWQSLIFAIMLTVFLGAFGAILYLVAQWIGRGRYEMFTALPYGQYIVIGTLIMLIWREPIRILLQGR